MIDHLLHLQYIHARYQPLMDEIQIQKLQYKNIGSSLNQRVWHKIKTKWVNEILQPFSRFELSPEIVKATCKTSMNHPTLRFVRFTVLLIMNASTMKTRNEKQNLQQLKKILLANFFERYLCYNEKNKTNLLWSHLLPQIYLQWPFFSDYLAQCSRLTRYK